MAAFGTAFAAARKAGKKTFTHNGKKYTTEVAKTVKTPKKGPIPESRPSAVAKAGSVKAAAPKSTLGGRKLTIGDRVSNAVDVVKKGGVARRNTRNAAAANNKGAGAAVSKMLSGMDKLKKK